MEAQSFEYSAKFYDLLYKDKNYAAEAKFIDRILDTYGKPTSILEIGCGTGNYTELLKKQGYHISGMDISSNMIKVAKKKCACNFFVADMTNFNLGEKFDACLALFAVLGYATKNSDFISTLKNIRAHLKPKGLLVFDVWNGLAVMRTLPELRIKEVSDSDLRIIRIANPKLNAFEHTVAVNYKLLALQKKDNIFTECDEIHLVRFFFPQEIKFILEELGFEILMACPFMRLNEIIDENTWNMTIVARLC
jgi:SAM-dependent methyltransferase